MRRLGALLALGLALALAYRTVFVYTFRAATCPPPARQAVTTPLAPTTQAAKEIVVLSYNIGGHTALVRGGHVDIVARLVGRLEPDVVGLQEVHRNTWQSRFRDQAAEIAARTGLEVHYGPSFRALGGEFGNAVLTRGRIVDGEVVALPSFGEPRTLLRTTVDLDGFELDVWVTHLTAWGSLNRRNREAQARCLADRVGGGPRPFVLMADLNATPDASELSALLGSPRMRLCGLPGDVTHALLARRLDYVFGDPRFEVVEARVVREGPSDHWPVLARLRWPGGT